MECGDDGRVLYHNGRLNGGTSGEVTEGAWCALATDDVWVIIRIELCIAELNQKHYLVKRLFAVA